MKKECLNPWCKQSFEVTSDDLAFYEKVSPVFGGKKFSIPPPTLCADCRLQRRLAWRNDRNLYHRTSNLSGQPLISMYNEKSSVKVFGKEEWLSDAWDAKSYGQEIDMHESFLAQLHALISRVPHAHSMAIDAENSPYVNYAYKNKNCYLCFAGNYLEDSYYCHNAQHSRNCIDCLFIYDSELCMECTHTQGCYNVQYALHCKNCRDSRFLEDCSGVSDCMMCCNLYQKQYCIQNEQYSKEGYFQKVEEMGLHSYEHSSRVFDEWRAFSQKQIKKFTHNTMSEDCTGEYILQSKNCHDCYVMAKECQDCTRIMNGFPGLKDSRDCAYTGEPGTELLYECIATGSSCSRILYGNLCIIGSSGLTYCHIMFGSENCFGCSNMNGASYCILNKQYTKDEYERLVPKIIEKMRSDGEWGEFLPPTMSPFGYNETVAQEFFPLKKEQATDRGFVWSDYTPAPPAADRLMRASDLPDMIDAAPDDIINCAIICEVTKRPFKIIKQELDFYQQMKLPLPRRHPDQRHTDRLNLRNPRKLWDRTCANCHTPIATSYSPERPERVLCEECYLEAVY